MMQNDRWERIRQSFDNDFPGMSGKAVSWWPSGRHEITLVLPDKRRVVYDEHDRSIRFIADEPRTEETWRIEFSFKLRDIMRSAGMTSIELAERVGVSPQMISKYLNRKSTPSYYVIEQIACALNCSVSELTQPLTIE